MLSFTTIVTFLMSALLAFAGVIPPAAYTPPAAVPPPAAKGAVPPPGAAPPPAGQAPPATVTPPTGYTPPATVVPQNTWKCPPDQGLFKFQGQLEIGSPMRCAYKIFGGIPYNCDYNMADGKLMYNINDFICPPSAAKAY